jgi:hypothetical protein
MKSTGEITSWARNAAARIVASPAPRNKKKSTPSARKAMIARVASDPRAWMKSARASMRPRRNEARRPVPSMTAAGTESPVKANQASAGRMKMLARTGAGR